MKIIGKTATGLLLEASTKEIANLCGYTDDWYMPHRGENIIRPGVEINVSPMFATLSTIYHQAVKIREAQLALRTAAESLNLPLPIIEEVVSEIESSVPRDSR